MQLQLSLVTFEYRNKLPVRTVTIDGEPWFYAKDVCDALAIGNPSQAIVRIDRDDLSATEGVDSLGRRQKFAIVNESGLYDLVFQSRTEESKKFKRWVTKEVLPQIRKTGGFGKAQVTHAFVRRYNDNWERVDEGHFSVISELYIRVFGRFENAGHILAERGPDGREIRPDVSVGRRFSDWLNNFHRDVKDNFKKYSHLLPDGTEVEARQYPNSMWPLFIEYVDTVWMRECAPDYLGCRDVKALEFLPRLLPAPDPKQQQIDLANSKFHHMKEAIHKVADPTK